MKKKSIEEEKLNFWIISTLGRDEDLIKSSIKRAYRDFNRTLRGISVHQKDDKIGGLIDKIRAYVNTACANKFNDVSAFDNFHKECCDSLINEFDFLYKDSFIKLTYGQAQKWINMTLKYLFILGETKIKGIDLNYAFFHVPVDSIILTVLEKKYSISGVNASPWSKWNDYEEYLNYQKEIRNLSSKMNLSPIEFELVTFNTT